MSKPVFCRLVKIRFQGMRSLMLRKRIYIEVCGKLYQANYSYSEAHHLYASVIIGSKRKVYVRTDSGR